MSSTESSYVRKIKVSPEEFETIIATTRKELKDHTDFQGDEWSWIHELDDEGVFLFCYLIEDYKNQVVTQQTYENTVYTLTMLRRKFIPPHLEDTHGISQQDQLQLLFGLYEKLKRQSMSWQDCEAFIEDQIQTHHPNTQHLN